MATGKNYWAVDVKGTADFINRVRRFDKDVSRVLDREIKKAAEMVAVEARSNMPDEPLSGWGIWVAVKDGRDLGYEKGRAAGGIKPRNMLRTRKGTVSFWKVAVQEMDPAGAIFMLAGSVKGTNPGRGVTFKPNINAKNGEGAKDSGFWPRVLGPARNKKEAEAGDVIQTAVNNAIDQVNNGS